MNVRQSGKRRPTERFLTLADRICSFCFCASVALIVLLTAINTLGFAISRLPMVAVGADGVLAKLSGGLAGYEELVAQLSGVAVAAAMIAAGAQRAHVAVTFIALPARLSRLLDRFGLVLVGVTMAGLCWFLALGSLRAFNLSDTTPVLALPVWPFIGVGAFLCGLAALVALVSSGQRHG